MSSSLTTRMSVPSSLISVPAYLPNRTLSPTLTTGARTLRWGPPRSAMTMDYRQDRVNVMYDDTYKSTQVTCG